MKRIRPNLNLFAFALLIFSFFGQSKGYVYNPKDWLNLPFVKIIHSITADPFNVYIGTPDAIYVFNKLQNQITRTLTSSDGITGNIRICAFDRESGLLWIVADKTLIGYNVGINLIITLFPNFYIRSLGIADSYIYFLTDEKPWRMKKKDRKFQAVDKPDTNAVWFGERNSYKATNYSFLVPYFYLDENLIKHDIRVVFEDRKTLWVGADEYGILTYDLVTKQPISHWRVGLNIGKISKILSLDNDIWFIGTNGFAKHSAQTEDWDYYSTPFGATFSSKSVLLQPKILDLRRIQGISSLAQEHNNYWIGSGNRIYHYDQESNVLTPIFAFPIPIQAVSISEDTIFFIAANELYRYQAKTKMIDTIFDPYQKLAFGVFDLAQTESRRYFSVYGGFLSLDTLGNWQLHIPPGIDLSMPFTSLAGYDNYLFIGMADGLIVFNEEIEKYDFFTTKEGLLSNNMNAMYADSNYLWIGTDRGISRFSYRNVLP